MKSSTQITFMLVTLLGFSIAMLTQGYVFATTYPTDEFGQADMGQDIMELPVPYQETQAYSQGLYENQLPTMNKQILYNDGYGQSVGWNPDHNITLFAINDPGIDPLSSIVVVNVYQPELDPIVCGVDWLAIEYFEVVCDKPPLEDAQLHYVVINVEPVLPPETSSEAEQRYENTTQGAEFSGRSAIAESAGTEYGNNSATIQPLNMTAR